MRFHKLRIAWSKCWEAFNAQPYKKIGVPAYKMQFLGEPGGHVDVLKEELSTVLTSEGGTKSAYLSRVQYPGEDIVRIALFIDRIAPSGKMAKELAEQCAQIAPIDIFFFEDLFAPTKERIRGSIEPFYSQETQH